MFFGHVPDKEIFRTERRAIEGVVTTALLADTIVLKIAVEFNTFGFNILHTT